MKILMPIHAADQKQVCPYIIEWVYRTCWPIFIIILISSSAHAQDTTPCQFNPDSGPAMVIIPGGEFIMGSPEAEVDRSPREGPQHKVTIRTFAMAKCELTVAEFRYFVSETGYVTEAEKPDPNKTDGSAKGCSFSSDHSWQNPGFEQTPQDPVTCVSWVDAQAYILWLNQKTGVHYRLPAEAEWEYATRAGTVTPFSTGECISAAQANINNNVTYSNCSKGSIYLSKTAPVASYPTNPFGLYDVHGNVYEWTQDCWHANYDNAPKEGVAWLDTNGGDCTSRVVRGGSWIDTLRFQRSAYRVWSTPDDREDDIGFRLARTLEQK